MPKISVGRDEEDRKEHGLKGTGVIGKHLVGENEEAHTANPIHFDIARPHVMGLFGKRGTGKCLLPNQKVLTENGLENVEKIFERGMKKGEAEINENDEQLYRFEGCKTHSVTDRKESDENRIKACYRKRIDEKLLEVKTRSGRKITVTKEHPLLKSEGWENAEDISEGESIAIPWNIDLLGKNEELKVPEEFERAKFSTINQRESNLLESDGEKIPDVSDGSGSFRRMLADAEKKKLIEKNNNQIKVTGKGKSVLKERYTDQHYRVGKCRPIKLPEEVDEYLAEFMAYMIAEGHEQEVTGSNYRIIFTNNDTEFISRFQNIGEELFDLEFKNMDENSVYTNSYALKQFLEENGYRTGRNSFDKNIPNFIVRSEGNVARKFLQKYFDCEGNVTDQQIELSSASENIIEAILYMLLRFGLIGRVSEKEKYASNTEQQKVRTYYQITISGSNQLKKFKDKIDFSLDYKSDKLASIIKEGNTNTDTVPSAETIKKVRKAMGADRTQIAEHKQSLKAYEDGKYQPSREKLEEITSKLQSHLRDVETLKQELEREPELEKLEKLVEKSGILWKGLNQKLGYNKSGRKLLKYRKYEKNPEKLVEPCLEIFDKKHDLKAARENLEELKQLYQSDIYWDEVEEINEINYEGWVYDLTVESSHSFTAGFGGIYCHNSYSMGTIAEEIQSSELSKNLSTIIIDPMGIYWSMSRPNDRATTLLDSWQMKPKGFDAQVYIPKGKVGEFDEQGMPYDETFILDASDFTAEEWMMAFDIEINSKEGILLERVISTLKEERDNYGINEIAELCRKFDFPKDTQEALVNRFRSAEDWGVFGEESSLEKFTQRGELSIVDVSKFDNKSVRSLIVGLLARRILKKRMTARRIEEIDEMKNISENEMPITWMMIDEAHEFLPAKGKTPATDPLLRWVKIGREPGVSLVLATQQPAKLHPNALSQCDIVLSHRLTAKQDIDALGEIMQTYMRYDLKHYIDALPDRTGTGLILDDNSERAYPIQMRPRKSWHAGGTPDAFD